MFEFPHTRYYDSDLRELLAMYKKLTDEYDAIKAGYDELKQEVAEVYEYVNAEIQKALDAYTHQIDAKIALMDEAIAQALVDMGELAQDLQLYVDVKVNQCVLAINEVRAELTLALQDVDKDLQSQIDELRALIAQEKGYLINPMTARVGEQNDVIKMVYNWLRYPSTLSCGEIAAKGVKVEDIDKAVITVSEFSTNSKRIIKPVYMNPITGKWDYLPQVLSALAGYANNLAEDVESLAGEESSTVELLSGKTAEQWKRSQLFFESDERDTVIGDWYEGKLHVFEKVINFTATEENNSITFDVPSGSDFPIDDCLKMYSVSSGRELIAVDWTNDTQNHTVTVVVGSTCYGTAVTINYKRVYTA